MNRVRLTQCWNQAVPDNITAICPECLTQYSLKPDVIGKRMRCTEASCGAVFTVTPVEAEPVAAAIPSPAAETASRSSAQINEEVADWESAPPPIRSDANGELIEPPPIRSSASSLPTYLAPKPTRNTRRWVIVGLSIFVLGMAAWGGITIVRNVAQAEQNLADDAEQAYADGKFGDAAQRYRSLVEKYPHGIRSGEYRFLAALSDVRRLANAVPPDPEIAFQSLDRFWTDHGGSAYMSNRASDVHEAAQKILNDLIREGTDSLAGRSPNVKLAESRQHQAKQTCLLIERNAPPGVDVAGFRQKLDALSSAVERAKVTAAARQEILTLLNRPRADLESARDLIRRAGLTNDPDISTAWQRAEESLRKLVTYQSSGQSAAKEVTAVGPTAILPEPRGAAAAGPRVPALADGLLYALEARTGRLAWVERLGIDSIWLPQRIAGQDTEELWLIVSTEPLGISVRRSTDGSVVWFQSLESTPLGPPVIVQGRVFVALPGPQGRVLEFDSTSGQLNGYFEIGQPLAVGLATAAGTTRLYAPAMGQQVFVLDFGADDVGLPPRCVGTLNTGHMPGSLRATPKIIAGPDGHPTLLLTVAEGIGDCSLWLVRIGELTTTTPQIKRIRLPGWVWFSPSHDPERLAAITDRGMLGLFGIRRPGAFDPPIYPLLDKDVVAVTQSSSPHRGLIAHADELGLTILAGGQLQQWLLGIDRRHGRQLKPGWSLPAPLGVPLTDVWNNDVDSFTLTTRNLESGQTLATTVRTDTGAILWQRPLGYSPHSTHQLIANQIVTMDPRGSVIALPPVEDLTGLTNGWRFGGRELAGPIAGMVGQPTTTRTAGRMTAVIPVAHGVLFRWIDSDLKVHDKKIDLPSPLSGTVGISPDAAVLPLQNGQLVRAALGDSTARPIPGPTWRSPGVASDIPGQVTHWHDHTFLVSDGSRRLMTLEWPGGTDYRLGSAALERSRRLLGTIAVLPGTPPRVVVADAGGFVLLLRSDRLEIERTWRVGDDKRTITHGPVAIGNQICVVVDHRELICLDPSAPKPAWTFRSPGDGIIEEPVAMETGWVIADRDGRFWLLDPTSQPRNAEGFRLAANVAAAGPILNIDAGRIFVILTDGSAIIVTKDDLMK